MHNDFIRALPKSDLHVHLDGSLRIATIIELSKKIGAKLPSYTEEGLNELVFKSQYQNLMEYLQGFNYVYPILQTPEHLERVSYEFALDNIQEGVCYVEPRFAPQLHINANQDLRTVLLSVNHGLQKAQHEYNTSSVVISGAKPAFNYGIIVCAMRFFTTGMSDFFDAFLATQKLPPHDIFSKAAYELTTECLAIKKSTNLPIVALDIAGAEVGHPPELFTAAYDLAHKNYLRSTAHAGEACGSENIYQALFTLHTDRIGHGFHLLDKDPSQLVAYIADKQIPLEVCLTSNLQTLPNLKNISKHPFGKMQQAQLNTVICTDNRTVSKTTMTQELALAQQHFNLSNAEFKKLVMRGFLNSFYPQSFIAKQQYLAQVSHYYDLQEKLHDLNR